MSFWLKEQRKSGVLWSLLIKVRRLKSCEDGIFLKKYRVLSHFNSSVHIFIILWLIKQIYYFISHLHLFLNGGSYHKIHGYHYKGSTKRKSLIHNHLKI